MLALPNANDAELRNPVSCVESAIEQVVSGDVSGDAEQKQHLSAFAQASHRCVVPRRLTDQA